MQLAASVPSLPGLKYQVSRGLLFGSDRRDGALNLEGGAQGILTAAVVVPISETHDYDFAPLHVHPTLLNVPVTLQRIARRNLSG